MIRRRSKAQDRAACARRDALLAQREKLEVSSARRCIEQIKVTEASGGDTSELAKQRDDLDRRQIG